MPNGYMTGRFARRRHDGPPRVGTINQRAQRFRMRAGCIAWCKREGTHAKNSTILKIISDKGPPRVGTINQRSQKITLSVLQALLHTKEAIAIIKQDVER